MRGSIPKTCSEVPLGRKTLAYSPRHTLRQGYPPGVVATGFGCTITYRKADRDDRRGLGLARASSGAERFCASATEASVVLETMMLRSSRGSTGASWSLWWSVDQRQLGADRTVRGAHDYCYQ